MKKTVVLAVLMSMLTLVFASCAGNTEPEEQPIDEPKSETYHTTDEELSSVLDDSSLSNADLVGEIGKLAEKQIAEANGYREKIKELYRTRKEENPETFNDGVFKLDERLKTVDDYFDYLENEFENNIEFFESYAFMEYTIGTGGGIHMAQKRYECAKSYAEKAEAIYNDLV